MATPVEVWQHKVLRIPLFYKILLANSLIVGLGAVLGTVVTVWHVRNYPTDLHYELIAFFMFCGFAISFAVNFLVIRLALRPLDKLQEGVDRVQQGQLNVQIKPETLSDSRFDRLVATFNQMIATMEADSRELHRLSQDILQAQEVERQRMARELHDEAAQALTSLLVKLRLLERSKNPEEALSRVQELRELTAQALEEVRRVALELRPTILDDLGLGAALEWRVDELSAAAPVKANLSISGPGGHLPREVELVFYRVAQEALNNIARHSQARNASINLSEDNGWLKLEIADDGVGFEPSAPLQGTRRGLGLMGMRERLALVGGELKVESVPGQGTRLTARAPLPKLQETGDTNAQNSFAAGR